jgi:hypothetical protein
LKIFPRENPPLVFWSPEKLIPLSVPLPLPSLQSPLENAPPNGKKQVIPNEYGVEPRSKLAVGGKIASALLGKLLCDLANVRDESARTAGLDDGSEPASPFETYADPSGLPGASTADRAPRRAARTDLPLAAGGRPQVAASASAAPVVSASAFAGGLAPASRDPAAEGGGGEEAVMEEAPPAEEPEEDEDDESTMHRLCPTYAQDINSPLRHVRTRIYFTSESHVHSLVNVLRFAHLKYGFEQEEKERKKMREAEERALAGEERAATDTAAAALASEHPSPSAPPPPSPTPPPHMPFSSHPPLLSPEAIGESLVSYLRVLFWGGGGGREREREKVEKNDDVERRKLTLFSSSFSFFPRPTLGGKKTARLRESTPELDYMTHVVVRMYERARVPVSSPDRFRVEVLFSPGASVDPVARPAADHTLPVCPRWHLERDGGISLEEAEAALGPFSTAAASASLGVGNGFLGGVASGGTGGGFYGAAGGSSSRRWGDRSLSASGAGAAAACFAPSALGAKPAAGPSSSTFAFSPAASPVPSPAAPARKRE